MKTFIVSLVIGIIIWISQGVSCARANYEYEGKIGSYWSLADKASTIPQKAEYIDKFVKAIEKEKLAEHNALIYPTLDNETASNIRALKSLQSRLHEIKGMDPRSFEYQTAIQQITAQEQGEAA